MERIELRAYRPEDLDCIAALDTVCFEAPFRFSKAVTRRFAEAKNALSCLAWAIDEETGHATLAGFGIVHLERMGRGKSLGYVVTLDVAPANRRGGLGQCLMRSLEGIAARAGADEMVLHVSVDNHAAIRLYEHLGYEPVRHDDGFYGEGGDAVMYRRVLAPPSKA